MGIGAGVEDDARGFLCRSFVDRVHDLALVVRLPELDDEPVALRRLAAEVLDIVQRGVAVDPGSRVPSRLRLGPLRTYTVFAMERFAAVTQGYPAL